MLTDTFLTASMQDIQVAFYNCEDIILRYIHFASFLGYTFSPFPHIKNAALTELCLNSRLMS